MATIYQLMPLPQDMLQDWPDTAVKTRYTLQDDLAELLTKRHDRAKVLVLPRAYGSMPEEWFPLPRKPLYFDRDLQAIRSLESLGVEIATLHDQSEYDNWGQKSVDGLISLAFVVAQALAESEIKGIYEFLISKALEIRERQGVPAVAKIDVLHVEITDEKTIIDVEGFEGPAEAIADFVVRSIREHHARRDG